MKKYIIITGIIIVLVIAGIFAAKSFPGKKVVAQSNAKEFTVNAFRFGYSPDTITVNKGDKVKIIINNTDTTHGIRIPDLNLKGSDIIEFTADKTGEFVWYCAVYCGEGHTKMSGKLIVK